MLCCLSLKSKFYFLLLTTFSIIIQIKSQQPELIEGLEQPRQPIKNTLGGLYSGNITLFFRNSPYR
ncbi:unnamed protein product [Meloidogyne enterolobii]|uniref:Uncharacterized protein n=1 Tax=Meloidogyne enterolobii TaxID=390850 RepID=A0ACB0ZXF6_MELEN